MLEELTNLINNVGFPVATVAGMAWYIWYLTKNFTQERRELDEAHSKEIEKLAEVVQTNTIVTQRLVDLLERSTK